MSDFKWTAIKPLSDQERQIDLAATQPLYDSWALARQRLADSSPENLKKFKERLIRRLSIETGILERLYDLDRGTTEALVARGFAEELVSRSNTDIEPDHLIDFLRDQEAAIQLVVDCVAGKRRLTNGVMHELHAILTKHQNTTSAVDQVGRRHQITLRKGEFKKQPNNPNRPDGSLHEYCPPIQTESEIENLLRWFGQYSNEDPIIVASWLHHRFTQIHPYQDGNGRVGRALVTLVLLQADLLPLVIDRDLRTEYIDALEVADQGDLTPLAQLFARLERAAILEALSIDTDAEIAQERALTSAVIESLAAKFNRRMEEKNTELRSVNSLAEQLRTRTRAAIESTYNELKAPIAHLGEPDIHISNGGRDRNNAHWYKFDVIKLGSASGKFINFDEDHYFVKGAIRVARERLVFVASLHHVGRELSGIMEATAFARLESFEDSDDRERIAEEFTPCSLEPFVFTYKTEESQIAESYDRWLDSALAVAIKTYGDRL